MFAFSDALSCKIRYQLGNIRRPGNLYQANIWSSDADLDTPCISGLAWQRRIPAEQPLVAFPNFHVRPRRSTRAKVTEEHLTLRSGFSSADVSVLQERSKGERAQHWIVLVTSRQISLCEDSTLILASSLGGFRFIFQVPLPRLQWLAFQSNWINLRQSDTVDQIPDLYTRRNTPHTAPNSCTSKMHRD